MRGLLYLKPPKNFLHRGYMKSDVIRPHLVKAVITVFFTASINFLCIPLSWGTECKEVLRNRIVVESSEAYVKSFGYRIEKTASRIDIKNTRDKIVGYVEFSFKRADRSPLKIPLIYVSDIYVTGVDRDSYLSTALLKAISEDYPEANGFYGLIADENRKALQEFLDAGKTFEEAAVHTPFFRALNLLGFSKLHQSSRPTVIFVTK